ncbi:hypothetical protein T08_4273 [Trichinella sp. T8]|nr:hypothetical protein T08_4273 [Trichinella sp. T8]
MHGICSELYRNPLGRAVEIISSISEAAVSSNSVTIKEFQPKLPCRLSREIRNQKPPGYVCCTLLIFSDRLMPKKSIFGEKAFSRKLQNFMGFMALWTWFFSENRRKQFFRKLPSRFHDCVSDKEK